MTLKDDKNELESIIRASIKLAEERGDRRNVSRFADALGLYRKGQIGDSLARGESAAYLAAESPPASRSRWRKTAACSSAESAEWL